MKIIVYIVSQLGECRVTFLIGRNRVRFKPCIVHVGIKIVTRPDGLVQDKSGIRCRCCGSRISPVCGTRTPGSEETEDHDQDQYHAFHNAYESFFGGE